MMIIMSVHHHHHHHHHQRHDDYHVSWCSSFYTFQVSRYIEIKRDVRHPWQCKGCDDDSYEGTSSDAEDVVMIVFMTRMITVITPPFSSWSSSSQAALVMQRMLR